MDQLNSKGYKEQFKLSDKGLKAISSGKIIAPNHLRIKHRYRFDGMTNPGDESTLYALESEEGIKGTLVVSGDVHSDGFKEVVKRIPSDL
ncbi:hypothetical protein [Roseivirga sp.]|uniref:hypothetical protein n=1 Tax=Roseivirga sp. TaxID=1964215 RepID=UPI003B52FE8C